MFLWTACTVPLFAQQPSLAGRVLDSTGGVLPGVTVEAVPAAGGRAVITTTGSDGTHALALAPGTYVFNVLDAEVSDIDYFYASRLPGESAGGIDDVHFHPVESRAIRFGVATTF